MVAYSLLPPGLHTVQSPQFAQLCASGGAVPVRVYYAHLLDSKCQKVVGLLGDKLDRWKQLCLSIRSVGVVMRRHEFVFNVGCISPHTGLVILDLRGLARLMYEALPSRARWILFLCAHGEGVLQPILSGPSLISEASNRGPLNL